MVGVGALWVKDGWSLIQNPNPIKGRAQEGVPRPFKGASLSRQVPPPEGAGICEQASQDQILGLDL